MDIAFYAPLKSPRHHNPSGDRTFGKLLMRALRLAGAKPQLASELRTREGEGTLKKQQAIERKAEKTIQRLCQKWRKQAPKLWVTYHQYHKAPDLIGPSVARYFKIPYWVVEASYSPKQASGPWANWQQYSIDAIMQADRIFVVNPKDEEGLKLLGVNDQIVRLKPFLDTRPFQKAQQQRYEIRQQTCQAYGLNINEPWLLAAGMMRKGDKTKSYMGLAQVMKKLSLQPLQLLIAGDGKGAAEIQKAFANDTRVHFLGQLAKPDIINLMVASDLFIWPGINEAFGLAILEAQAAGLPVVSANRPGIANIVLHQSSGLLSSEGDINSMVKDTMKLLKAPDQLKRMSDKSIDNIRNHHSLQGAAAIFKQQLGNLP